MIRLLLLTCALGCAAKHDDYPIGPGGPGGPGGIGGGADAASDGVAGDGGATIDGRVCLTSDLRRLDACSNTAAAGLTVTLGAKTATTDATGQFSIEMPAGTNLTWRVTGGAIVTSVEQFSISRVLVAISEVDYNALGAVIDADKGSMIVRLVRGGAPLVGATATVTPNGGTYQPFYDGPSVLAWTQTATGAFGVVWLPDAAATAQTMTITPASGSPHTESGIVVEAGAIRFATIDVP